MSYNTSKQNKKSRKRTSNLPPSFPSDKYGIDVIPGRKGFLSNTSADAYRVALETSYEGFVSDNHFEGCQEKEIQKSLSVMDDAGLFRFDITQPFGLGSKCAKTYVSRCLLGEEGTTYRYLGLRMFSHPWNGYHGASGVASDTELHDAIKTISKLNLKLEERTKSLLPKLMDKRTRRGINAHDAIKGRSKFDVALINKMDSSEELKAEPSFGGARCSVSWHADSSLEHYSTIAVYQTIVGDDTRQKKSAIDPRSSWSVALRVLHNAEGPAAASVVKTDSTTSVSSNAPPILTSLPSGSAYFLLDDFNHHHQHAVIAPSSSTQSVRFSSTHRLLREGGNVSFILQRCATACSNFHRKGPKIWRSEQLLLTEIETEWLRQFYIQGEGNKRLLWKWWGKPICQLFSYWSKLEDRTKQVINLLISAAKGRCTNNNIFATKNDERKAKKAFNSINDIVERSKISCAKECLYDPFASLLEDRATMRKLWADREKDHVFTRVGTDYRPIPFPVEFGACNQRKKSDNDCIFQSSMVGGSPKDLQHIAYDIRAFGQFFISTDIAKIPQETSILNTQSSLSRKKDTAITEIGHNVDEKWTGWKTHQFGLEMQRPWAALALDKKKTIETRSYKLPPDLMNKKIEVLETEVGTVGVSELENIIEDENLFKSIDRIGWLVVDRIIEYASREHFEADEGKHLVKSDSVYGWHDGKTKVIYGWVIGQCGRYTDEKNRVVNLTRRMRSLFQITYGDPTGDTKIGKPNENRKKRTTKDQGKVHSGAVKKKKRRF
mmetsp:Transcript_594/g.982  ORF Transcript_594/g.982 Transcript_594/m.982 type:complete len:777 (-) Transcript_594:171-2501(-)